ncbi:MAG: CDP-diacylglycerol---glycerol-3-phosphate 3-phosphatidyltransferase [Chloroflexota bacterium]|nr:CDP-diacylglycerol---glycerol-3-phosphate 3-phosphatidyltransferase [Chloroflexota bacterium]
MAKGSLVSAQLRATTRSRVEPIAALFGRVGLTPNALTFIGFVIAVVAAFVAASQAWIAAGLLVAFGAAFDMFDGALARATGTSSRYGAFLDSTLDRAGEAVIYIGIGWGAFVATAYSSLPDSLPLLVMTAMAAAFMVSYTRAKSESLGFTAGKGMAAVGLAPREVRIVILSVGLVLTGLAGGLPDAEMRWWQYALGEGWLMLSLGLITLLGTITTVQRIIYVYQQSKSQSEDNR